MHSEQTGTNDILSARHPRCTIMTHQTTNMTEVESGAERFSEGVRGVDDARDVTKDNIAIGLPLLNGEMLNINMSRTWRRSTRVNHQNRCLIVLVKHRWTRLCIVQLEEDRSQIFCNLRGLDGGDEFGFCRACRDRRLDLRLVCNWSTTEHESETGDGTSCAEIRGVCGINIASEGGG